MTLITVTNGQGRPKNPFDQDGGHISKAEFNYFEQSVQYHEAPEITQSECEAELVWQFYDKYGEYWANCSQRTAENYCNGVQTRKIWVIKPEKEERKEEKLNT